MHRATRLRQLRDQHRIGREIGIGEDGKKYGGR